MDPTIEPIGLMALIWLAVIFFFGRRLLQVFQMLFQDAQFVRLLEFVGIILTSGAHIYHRLEGWSYLDSFYFTIITLTTVCYGDFSPQTSLGKLFSMLYILLGLGVLGAFIAILKEQSSGNEDHE